MNGGAFWGIDPRDATRKSRPGLTMDESPGDDPLVIFGSTTVPPQGVKRVLVKPETPEGVHYGLTSDTYFTARGLVAVSSTVFAGFALKDGVRMMLHQRVRMMLIEAKLAGEPVPPGATRL